MVTQQVKQVTLIYYLVFYPGQKSRYRTCSLVWASTGCLLGLWLLLRTINRYPHLNLLIVLSVYFLEVSALLSVTDLGWLGAIRGPLHFLVTRVPIVRLLFGFSQNWCALLLPSTNGSAA